MLGLLLPPVDMEEMGDLLLSLALLNTSNVLVVVVDSQGNLYIKESTSLIQRIRKVNKTTGIISTVAGGGAVSLIWPSSNNVAATSIYLNGNYGYNYGGGLAVDPSGNIYFGADMNTWKVDVNGILTTIWKGSDFASVGQIYWPRLHQYFNGSLYVVTTNDQVFRLDLLTNNSYLFAGNGWLDASRTVASGDGGPATAAVFSGAISAIAVDSGGFRVLESDSLTGHDSEGVDDSIADLMELLSGVWLMKIGETGFREEPLSGWLRAYLSDPEENGQYSAFSSADRVWSVYSFFLIDKPTNDLQVAFENLVKLAGLTGEELAASDEFLNAIIEGENSRPGLKEKIIKRGNLRNRAAAVKLGNWSGRAGLSDDRASPSSVKLGNWSGKVALVDQMESRSVDEEMGEIMLL